MSVRLTSGKRGEGKRGDMQHSLPKEFGERECVRTLISIEQLDHVVHVQWDRPGHRFIITHDIGVAHGKQVDDALCELDLKITNRIEESRKASPFTTVEQAIQSLISSS